MTTNSCASDHFKNGRFFNPGAPPQSFARFLKWVTRRKMGPWRRFVTTPPGPRPADRVSGSQLRVTFVNHSTFLLQSESFNILTDPVWSERVSPVSFLGPQRHRNPGILFEDIPPIDCILISHNHYDHLDMPTLKRLASQHQSAVFCPHGLAGLVARAGFEEVYSLDWWQLHAWKGLRLHCVPAQHFSSRTPFDRNRTLWCGWVVEYAAGPVYFAGDTGFGNHFAAINAQVDAFRLALLPIGGFKPEWFMGPLHMTPEEAVEAHRILNSQTSVAMHFGTFALADDGETEPTCRLNACLGGSQDASEFWTMSEGESRNVPRSATNRSESPGI